MLIRVEILDATGRSVNEFWREGLLGWPTWADASRELRSRAGWLRPEPLICGGYETTDPHPGTGLRERLTFWAERP